MSIPISKQVVLITGSGRGLGSSLAKSFAREGATVIINYRKSQTQATQLADRLGDGAMAISADIREASQVENMRDVIQSKNLSVTTIVHNAIDDYHFNGDMRKKIDEIQWSDLLCQMRTTQQGYINILHAFVPDMKRNTFGRIINIGTNLFQNPVVPYHDYISAKAGLLSLTRTSSVDLGPHGITVNMISGGLLKITDASKSTPEAVFEHIAAITPLRKVITIEEMADAALFFASPWSRSVTGQNLVVDGGLTMN